MGEQLSVYDPDLDKRFIMVNGDDVEAPEDDVEDPEDDVENPKDNMETGTNTCCGWWRGTEPVEEIRAENGNLDGSEKVPLTTLELSGGAVRAGGEEAEGKTEL